MYKWLIPMISTALLALPAASFAADEKAKPPAKQMTKSDMAPSKSAMAGKSDGGDKPKPEKPPKKEAMTSKVGMASMAGKSDGGDKPKPEKPPKKDGMASKVGMTGMAGKSDGGDKPKPEKPPKKDAVRAANAVSR